MLALSFSLLFLACFEEGKRLHHAAVGVELRVQPGRVQPAGPEVGLHDLIPLGHFGATVLRDGPQLRSLLVFEEEGGGGDTDRRMEKGG